MASVFAGMARSCVFNRRRNTMVAQLSHVYISEEEYLAEELLRETKHEYIDGVVYAMAGASKNHQRICSNVTRLFGNHMQGKPCDVYSSDVKVKAGRKFFYPDVMVVCTDVTAHEYYTESPVLVVEVLSKSTRRKDKTLKRLAYQNLASLQEYVLIEQDYVEITVYRRCEHWQPEYYYLGDEAYFASLDLKLPVEAVYARVENEDMAEFLKGKAEAGAA